MSIQKTMIETKKEPVDVGALKDHDGDGSAPVSNRAALNHAASRLVATDDDDDDDDVLISSGDEDGDNGVEALSPAPIRPKKEVHQKISH